ncbi:adenylate/guanylate cyclase domain-containing protein [Tropicibacter sp. Alg240-R139]|uniref:adenylate/guanylate cyclase domain-containing protein n=1 Tax=Tropicibacter sp. Alg240-R139 TaxID=2305991 RepID=UPI0013E0BC61|nr:adenylate/guanylate cyclase domain-containing protein [Tropicibacter sp. Alg240-R139]
MTDMVGYSRLMEQDEAATLSRQKSHRNGLINPALANHHGRVVKTTGDGLPAEFPSVVEAVAYSADFQREMAKREADQPKDKRIDYRIGIHLDDVFL